MLQSLYNKVPLENATTSIIFYQYLLIFVNIS